MERVLFSVSFGVRHNIKYIRDSQRVVSMAAVVYCLYKFYDCPHNHGHNGVYLHVSLSMLNSNY